MRLTEAGFAQRCAYIAAKAAHWSGDSMTLPELYNQPIKIETVARFTDEIRGMLDRIDEQAGRAALRASQGEGER